MASFADFFDIAALTMRISDPQIHMIREIVNDLAGPDAEVRLFGSRLDDNAKGGDVDLLVKVPRPVTHPAMLAAGISARVSRRMYGRKVDVLIAAPNLRRLPIHEVAARDGLRL